jgi:hypothetical protein
LEKYSEWNPTDARNKKENIEREREIQREFKIRRVLLYMLG